VDLLVETRPGRGCAVVEVRGDLDMATSPQLRESLQRLIDGGERQVVVDAKGLGFMDSSALGTLVIVLRALRDVGGNLRLAGARPAVRSVLSITSVDRVIDVFDTVEAAEAVMMSTGG
jgi:anti-sigma B factor antagonist